MPRRLSTDVSLSTRLSAMNDTSTRHTAFQAILAKRCLRGFRILHEYRRSADYWNITGPMGLNGCLPEKHSFTTRSPFRPKGVGKKCLKSNT